MLLGGGFAIESIYSVIHEQNKQFSKGFKKIATYFLREPEVFALNSASRAGQLIGVSETTVIRFSYELGYSGYRDLQRDVQDKLFKRSSLSAYLESKQVDQAAEYPIKNVMLNEISSMQRLLQEVSESDLELVVSKLIHAEEIIICGSQASQSFASWFAFALDLIRGNSKYYQSNIDNVLLRASELTNKSVIVAFSFHRYAIETINMAKIGKERGASVIAFTDSMISPITEYADVAIALHLYEKSTLDMAPVVFTLLHGITSTISIRNKELFQERIDRFDSMKPEGFFVDTISDT